MTYLAKRAALDEYHACGMVVKKRRRCNAIVSLAAGIVCGRAVHGFWWIKVGISLAHTSYPRVA